MRQTHRKERKGRNSLPLRKSSVKKVTSVFLSNSVIVLLDFKIFSLNCSFYWLFAAFSKASHRSLMLVLLQGSDGNGELASAPARTAQPQQCFRGGQQCGSHCSKTEGVGGSEWSGTKREVSWAEGQCQHTEEEGL